MGLKELLHQVTSVGLLLTRVDKVFIASTVAIPRDSTLPLPLSTTRAGFCHLQQ
jgi:hypothetical protein